MSEQTSIKDPARDVLAEGFLHRLMVAFDQPSRLPGWVIWLIGAMLALFAGWAWRSVSGDEQIARGITVIQWLFMAGDTTLLVNLPRRGISFGPWKAQFFTLALPRLAATLIISFTARWLGPGWSVVLVLMAQLTGSVALMWGAVFEPFRLKLTEIHLRTDRLPPDTSPIRLLHISDLHVERLTRREQQVLELVRKVKPDLILITGDYVNLSYNRDPETHAQVRQLLSQLEAPYGVYATLGSPTVDLRETLVPIFDDLPVKLMRQHWSQITLDDGRQLVLLGLDCTHHIPTDEVRLGQLMTAAPNGVPQVLLYHSPELMPQASQHGIDLYLCGHTHGGQVRLPFIGPILTSSQLGRRYVMGTYQEGRTHLYVSRGIGLEGLSAPRVRFLAPPEMTLIVLRPAA